MDRNIYVTDVERWVVELYRTAGGEPVVEQEIEDIGDDAAPKLARAIRLLEVRGLLLGEPMVKHVQGKIWELRPDRYRALYFATTGRTFVILRVFAKKTARTPKGEILQAERRMNDYEARSKGDQR